jgi:molybdenum cofactor biosynthesis enzyme MoaA
MKYKSCRLLEHGIYFYQDPGTQHLIAGHCCNTDHLHFDDRLYMYFDLANEKLDWNYIFSEKRKLRENAKKGIYPSQCDGCFELTERDWDDEDYINHLTAGHIMKCNSRCIYCPTGRIPEWHNREQEVDLKPIIAELSEKNLLRYDGSLRFVGGEPTIMKEFDWLVDLFSEKNVPEIYVPTSAIRLSKSLCKAIEKVESAAIVVSVDSGTRETFEKIKGTKFYDLVHNNIKTYLNHARKKDFVISKFILFTNYNDTANEVELWLKKCRDEGIIEVQFDAEHSVSSSEECENKKYINRTVKMLKFAEHCAMQYNIKVTSFLAFMNRAQRIYEQQTKFYQDNRNSFKDLYIDSTIKTAKDDVFYNNLFINIENLSVDSLNEILDKLAREEKLSANRRAYLNSAGEITIDENIEKMIMLLLRLGYDIEFATKEIKYNKVIDEMLKTSYSVVTFDVKSKIPFMEKYNKSKILKQYNKVLGEIRFV